MSGKTTCKTLKNIRKQIADANGIPFEVTECTYQGECPGTCPKCEAELKELDAALEEKRKRGEEVVIPDIEIPEKGCKADGIGPQNRGRPHGSLRGKFPAPPEEGPRGEVPSMRVDLTMPDGMRPIDPKFMKPLRGEVVMEKPQEPLMGQIKPPPEGPIRPDGDKEKAEPEPLMGKIAEPPDIPKSEKPKPKPEPPEPAEIEEPVLMGDVLAPSDLPGDESADEPEDDPELVVTGEVPAPELPKKPAFFRRLLSFFRRGK
ncbi:MAG: hypothetical protein IJM20_00570 [Clostridia bacterium]|nr:hypothetical protein [Clostridia bacterium]